MIALPITLNRLSLLDVVLRLFLLRVLARNPIHLLYRCVQDLKPIVVWAHGVTGVFFRSNARSIHLKSVNSARVDTIVSSDVGRPHKSIHRCEIPRPRVVYFRHVIGGMS